VAGKQGSDRSQQVFFGGADDRAFFRKLDVPAPREGIHNAFKNQPVIRALRLVQDCARSFQVRAIGTGGLKMMRPHQASQQYHRPPTQRAGGQGAYRAADKNEEQE